MSSEYDSLSLTRAASHADTEAFEQVRELFQVAGRPYLSSPWSWLAWGVALPTAALLTRVVAEQGGFPWVAILWSAAILAAGLVEGWAMLQAGAGGSPLASWALHVQGNLSLVALVLSILLLVRHQASALPGLWLLLLGHSFYSLGGLSYRELRRYGLAYQLGGISALLFAGAALPIFAVTTAAANVTLALAIWQRQRAAPHRP